MQFASTIFHTKNKENSVYFVNKFTTEGSISKVTQSNMIAIPVNLHGFKKNKIPTRILKVEKIT